MSRKDELVQEYGLFWDRFVTFTKQNSISLEAQEDWEPWWDCFKAGSDAHIPFLVNPTTQTKPKGE